MDKSLWQKMTIYEQFGNIASEISRAKHWHEQHDARHRDLALERVLQLVDLTLEQNQQSERVREIARFRDLVGQWLIDERDLDVLPEDIENYCLPFAIRARGDN
jgi:hypothetical protein